MGSFPTSPLNWHMLALLSWQSVIETLRSSAFRKENRRKKRPSLQTFYYYFMPQFHHHAQIKGYSLEKIFEDLSSRKGQT